MTTDTPDTAELRQQIAQAAALGFFPPEELAKLSELVDQLEAGQITGEEAEAQAAVIYEGLMGQTMAAAEAAGIDPAMIGLDVPPAPAVDPSAIDPGLVEFLRNAEAQNLTVVVPPRAAGELADLASFALWQQQEAYPVLEGLRPFVNRVAELGPAIREAGPTDLVRLFLPSFGRQS